MKIKPINVVIGLIIYFVVEDFALKFLPVPNMLYTLLRFGGELFLYFFTIMMVISRSKRGLGIRMTPLDRYFAAFALAIIISGVINLSPIFYTVLKFRILFRYVAGFYLIMQLDPNEEDVRKILRTLITIGVVQVVIGMWQHFVEVRVSDFWMPREVDLVVGGVAKNFRSLEGLDAGTIIGTMVMPGQLATFFMLVSTLLVTYMFYRNGRNTLGFFKKPLYFWICLGLLLLGTFISYSRASILMVALAFPVATLFSGNLNRLLQLGILGLSVVVLVGIVVAPVIKIAELTNIAPAAEKSEIENTPLDELVHGFSLEYLQGEASNNRLWVMQHVGGTIFKEFRVFGYGTEETYVRYALYVRGVPDRILTYKPFKDVYWFNMLAHFGVFGVVAFALILIRIYRMARWLYREEPPGMYKFLALFMRVFIIIFALKTFFLSTLEYRPIGYMLWTLVGLLTVRYMQVKKMKEAEG